MEAGLPLCRGERLEIVNQQGALQVGDRAGSDLERGGGVNPRPHMGGGVDATPPQVGFVLCTPCF